MSTKLFACLLISFFFCSCKTNQSDVINDVISYNKVVLNLDVSNCKIVENNASCANKSESYIIECSGSDNWYKWDKDYIGGEEVVSVYTIPKNFNNYRCNPLLDSKKQYKAHKKSGNSWTPKDYTDK
jgi:hypothetical protein